MSVGMQELVKTDEGILDLSKPLVVLCLWKVWCGALACYEKIADGTWN